MSDLADLKDRYRRSLQAFIRGDPDAASEKQFHAPNSRCGRLALARRLARGTRELRGR